ncbi:unnamed protein product [Moneuplotes crassus]|uniref:Uncharacterized protein n=1 Tax=Euplotes crassus TaxID=5936 RepID=A0AAD1Y8T6_EUPCR|nr:unnamed protein product [Moneuplotes crassus]
MSVAREYKLRELCSNPITHFQQRATTPGPQRRGEFKSMGQIKDFKFLYEAQANKVRMTDTFKSSVIPEQQRDLSSTLVIGNQQPREKNGQAPAVKSARRERCKSAVFAQPSEGFDIKSKNFEEIMNEGHQRLRVNPTFTSSVMPMGISNLAHQNHAPSAGEKWKLQKEDIIPEKINNVNRKKSDMHKMYFGLKDTPFQRYFKEHYGDKHKAPSRGNCKSQHNIGQTVGFNAYSNKKDVYKDLDAEGRRAKELDSCLWAESNGNYKSFTQKDMTQKDKTNISATTGWHCKEAARRHDNKDKAVNSKKITQENLASQVLPMGTYKAPTMYSTYQQESKDDRRKLFDTKKFHKKQRVMVTNTNWNDTKSEGLLNNGGYERKSFINLLNQSALQRDPANHHLTKSIDSGINLSSIKKQENLASNIGISNLYEEFLTKKVNEKQNSPSKIKVASVDQYNHKELRQKNLEGQEDRYMFNAQKAAPAKRTDTSVHTLDMHNIPAGVDKDNLKRALGNLHVVSLDINTDHLKNVSTGEGRICFRSNTESEKEKIQETLKDIGISTSDYIFKNKNRTSRIGTTQVSVLDSRNEIDCSKGKRTMKVENNADKKDKSTTKVTGKVGENLFIRPKDYLKQTKNDTRTKRTAFYESCGDLLGNTNGTYAKNHLEKVKRNRKNLDKNMKNIQVQNKLIHDWTKMQKYDKYAKNRALGQTTSRYGTVHKF